ncbi:hypothetical protein UFOVP1360_30 [uncultured Caudovirales phage]|uniref:Uncharacterized protein n=1 Tax=uncultured Caudovirales phage TaxID=2100421 RepID=A0A6J5RU79_9CAUD|nr:hypothetical protein UFOVP1360_30 [uncultured Caudovirales phage]
MALSAIRNAELPLSEVHGREVEWVQSDATGAWVGVVDNTPGHFLTMHVSENGMQYTVLLDELQGKPRELVAGTIDRPATHVLHAMNAACQWIEDHMTADLVVIEAPAFGSGDYGKTPAQVAQRKAMARRAANLGALNGTATRIAGTLDVTRCIVGENADSESLIEQARDALKLAQALIEGAVQIERTAFAEQGYPSEVVALIVGGE